jgi:exodeoxyribonuclease VII small subunit
MSKIQTHKKKKVHEHKYHEDIKKSELLQDNDYIRNSEIDLEFKNLSFESAIMKLEEIANKLESKDISITDTMELCKQGRILHDFCAAKLYEAQLAVTDIIITDKKEAALKKSELQQLYSKDKIN